MRPAHLVAGPSRAAEFRRALRGRVPELWLLALGIALRLSMAYGSSADQGYDFPDHWMYVQWFAQHAELPSVALSREADQPPLYYALAGLLVRLGATASGLAILSGLLGCARLGLTYLGLELYLPETRLARRVALALAAVLPAAVHLDGMVTNEGLFALLAVLAQLLMPRILRRPGPRRWGPAAALGLVLGLALLTKISALALIGAFGLTILLELLVDRAGGWRGRMARMAPLVLGLCVAGATAGWYLGYNQRLYGKPFLTGFDGLDRWALASIEDVPYFRRRSPSFVVGWDWAIYRMPYFPSGLAEQRPTGMFAKPRFFPVVIASTFADYYTYYYAPPPQRPPWIETLRRPLRPAALVFSRLSVVGGTVIALATTLAWLGAARFVWRARDLGRLALLLVPLMGLLGQLHFAVRFPIDFMGPIKGTYLAFATGPLCALFGVAVAALWERPRLRVLAGLALGALALVASYSLYCRVAAVLVAAQLG